MDDEAPDEAPRDGAASGAAPSTTGAALAPEPPPRARRALAALREFFAWMRDHYGRMDPRTAGLFRIVLGLLCSADLVRHWASARVFYSNDGILTNHWHLFKPSSGFNFSLFHAFSSLGEVHVA